MVFLVLFKNLFLPTLRRKSGTPPGLARLLRRAAALRLPRLTWLSLPVMTVVLVSLFSCLTQIIPENLSTRIRCWMPLYLARSVPQDCIGSIGSGSCRGAQPVQWRAWNVLVNLLQPSIIESPFLRLEQKLRSPRHRFEPHGMGNRHNFY